MKRRCLVACLAWAITSLSASFAVAETMNFESIPVGTRYGAAFGDIPGSPPVLTEDGIDMTVENFILGSFTGFIRAEVGGQYGAFFPTTPLELDNISVAFDFTSLPFDVTIVTLEFLDFGVVGGTNISANNGTRFSLDTVPTNIAPGVTASIENDLITMTGSIDRLLIGGQELAIDNVTALPEPTTALLLGLTTGLLALRRRSRRLPL